MNTERNELVTVTLVQTWILDLVNIGMSYSRISMRLSLSASTVQKIVKKNRMPRDKTLIILAKYYLKIFENPQACLPKVLEYYRNNEARIKETIEQTRLVLLRFLEGA